MKTIPKATSNIIRHSLKKEKNKSKKVTEVNIQISRFITFFKETLFALMPGEFYRLKRDIEELSY